MRSLQLEEIILETPETLCPLNYLLLGDANQFTLRIHKRDKTENSALMGLCDVVSRRGVMRGGAVMMTGSCFFIGSVMFSNRFWAFHDLIKRTPNRIERIQPCRETEPIFTEQNTTGRLRSRPISIGNFPDQRGNMTSSATC